MLGIPSSYGSLTGDDLGRLLTMTRGQALGIHPDALQAWLVRNPDRSHRDVRPRPSRNNKQRKPKPTAQEMRDRVYRLRRESIR